MANTPVQQRGGTGGCAQVMDACRARGGIGASTRRDDGRGHWPAEGNPFARARGRGNRELVLDLLWYILEWVVDTVEEAEASVICVNRIYALFIEGRNADGWFIADEHLYTCVRLLGAVSERVDYIQRHNHNGTAVEKTSLALKDLLSGALSAVAFEQHCKSTYGEDQGWQVLLADMGVILKRFGNAAKKLPERTIALKLLALAEEKLGVKRVEKVEDVPVAPRKNDGGKSQETSAAKERGEGQKEENADTMEVDTARKEKEDKKDEAPEEEAKMSDMAYVRESMRLTEDCMCEMFRVDFLTKLVRNKPETQVVLSHMGRYIASQHPRIEEVEAAIGEEAEAVDKKSSAYARYVERRSRKRAAVEREQGVIAKVLRSDGLDIRYDVGRGQRVYVTGTEDFVCRIDSRARKMRRLAKTKLGVSDTAPVEKQSKVPSPQKDPAEAHKTGNKAGHCRQALNGTTAEPARTEHDAQATRVGQAQEPEQVQEAN